MNILLISATDLKHNTAEVLNAVYFKKRIVVVKRHGKAIAEIRPVIESSKSDKKTLADYFGVLPEFPDVTKDRASRKESVTL